jgi:hypothetical protein
MILFRECLADGIPGVLMPMTGLAGKLREGLVSSNRKDAFALEGVYGGLRSSKLYDLMQCPNTSLRDITVSGRSL